MNNNHINTIITGDCISVIQDVETNSVDLVITSPPYYKQREYGGIGFGNESSEEEYINNLLKVFSKCLRVLRNTGSIVFNLGDKYCEGSLSLLPYKFAISILRQFNVKLVNQVVWIKSNPTPRQDKHKLVQSTEPFFIFTKSDNYYFDYDAFMSHLDNFRIKSNSRQSNGIGKRYFELINQSDLSETERLKAKAELEKVINEVYNGEIESFRMKIRNIHSQPYGGQEGGRKIHIERDGFTIIRILGKGMRKDVIESPVECIKGNQHPAVYPMFVVQQFIKLLTKKGDTVLDPFCGSGTTCIAALNLNRDYIGIEINPNYVNYANERIKQFDHFNAEEILI